MHIYYTTETIQSQIVDENMKMQINDDKVQKKASQKMFQRLQNQQKLWVAQQKKIVSSIAKFTFFFENNSIMAYTDAFENYWTEN